MEYVFFVKTYGTQGRQYACPALSCENPVGQFRHVADSLYDPTVSENLLVLQLIQESIEIAPFGLVEPYLPASQLIPELQRVIEIK